MGEPAHRPTAAELPEGDVIRILLEQHVRIRVLFGDVRSAMGGHKRQAFDELRALLAVHETAEEMVLRPVSADAAGEAVGHARAKEERISLREAAYLVGIERVVEASRTRGYV